MSTERKGPFFIERQEDLGVVQSKARFNAVRITVIEAEQDGVMWRTRPFVLNRGDRLVLSTVGHSDVVVDGGGAA